MKEMEVMKKIRVAAPPDFEQKVMAGLSLRKRERLRIRRLRFSMAGAFVGIMVVVVAVGLLVLPRMNPAEFARIKAVPPPDILDTQSSDVEDYIPIIEAVDYNGELRSVRREEPSTIYILEQVSYRTDTRAKY